MKSPRKIKEKIKSKMNKCTLAECRHEALKMVFFGHCTVEGCQNYLSTCPAHGV